MKTKYYLIFLALLLSFGFHDKAYSQSCLTFKYDADGNRISRTLNANCQVVRGEAEAQEAEMAQGEVRVYPNPSDGSFKVLMPEDLMQDNANYELYDVNGTLITSGIINGIETDIDIGNNPSGVYLLRIISGDEELSEVIVKQ